MELVTQVRIMDKAVCISLISNALKKGMNLSFFHSLHKIVVQSVYLSSSKATNVEEKL